MVGDFVKQSTAEMDKTLAEVRSSLLKKINAVLLSPRIQKEIQKAT
jgi:hypothetical protein